MERRRADQRSHQDLRQAAEARLAALPGAPAPPKDLAPILHELQVHQIELEMQNDELRRALAALEEGRDLYWALYDYAPSGYLTLEADGTIVETNLTAAALLGIETNRLVGRRISAFMDQPDADRFFLCRREAVASETKQGCDVQFRRPDGKAVQVHLEVALAAGRNDGRLEAAVVDVTDLRQAQKGERDSQALFLQIAERIDDVFYVREPGGRVIYVNPAFERIWGRPIEWLIGRDAAWMETVDPEDRDRVEAAWTRQRHGVTIDETYRIRRPDGAVRWVQNRGGSTVEASPGKECNCVGVIRDITDERLMEEELRQSQKMEALGTLAGGLAHNLGNVLQSILASIQLALRAQNKDDPQNARRSLERADAVAKKGAAFIRQLMSFARKQEGELKLRRLRVDEVLRDVEGLLTPLLGDRIVLEIAPAAPGSFVMADPIQLEQILLNLGANARDAMPNGGRLTIGSWQTTVDEPTARVHGVSPGPHVIVAVRDSGRGMDAATKSRIFEPFFTTKEVGKGTGLGLSTVFALVRQSGGWVDVESTPGVGTTFTVSLPALQDETVTPGPDSSWHPPDRHEDRPDGR